MSVIYSQVLPTNNKESYDPFDLVEFVMTGEGTKLKKGSVRLVGEFRATKTGANLTTADDVKISPDAGITSVLEQIQTETQNQGVLESWSECGRYSVMKNQASMTMDDTFNSENIVELRTPNEKVSRQVILGQTTKSGGSTINDNNQFVLKPDFCLNNSSADVPFDKTGFMRVSFTLARAFNVLYGSSVDSTCSYKLYKLKLTYTTEPVDGTETMPLMKRKIFIKQALTSGTTSVQTKVPGVVSAVSCSFLKQQNENSAIPNTLQTEVLPQLKNVQYLFSGNTNEYLAFRLNSREEILSRYLSSFGEMDKNKMTLRNLSCNNSFGIGLDFAEPVDLTQTSFNIQMNAEATASAPYVIYMFFHSLISLS